MRLLILLSALLAGLTGIIAGQPAFAHRGEQAALASNATEPAEQTGEIGAVGVPTSDWVGETPRPLAAWRLHPATAPRGERQLE